jgi:hypothetical protein
MQRFLPRLVCVAVASLATFVPVRAFAELGGTVKSVEQDRARMRASIVVRQTDRYRVYEMKSDATVTVREFADADGHIFAVAWQGAFHPDYRQLLGTYFDQLQQATKVRRPRRAPLTIDTPGFVFQSFGHVRALAGRAYIPRMLPAGVAVEEIR